MTSQGPRDPTAAASVDGANYAWSNPNNALLLDGVYATADARASPTVIDTQYLQTTNYGFSIPVGATINGIVVAITRYPVDTDDTYTDKVVQLIKSGVKTGDNNADTINTWSLGVQTITYGTGTTDLWGTTWSVAEINATDFGVALQVQSNDISYGSNISVDVMRITIYYTAGAGGNVVAWLIA